MDFGVVLQTNPPAWRTVDLARQAETHGFDYVWTFDSHLLWQEPFVIYSAILAATHTVKVGPMVTNPATRDWTVIASLFATLNEMFGNRTVCGIGRGDSAEAAGRNPDDVQFCVAAPGYVGDGASPSERAPMREQCRWFGGMVGNHVAEIVRRYGTDSAVPKALTDYIRDREGYDYNEHGRAGNSHTTFVPDEIVERFCLLGSPHEHVEKLRVLESLGCTQFALYLQHDNKEETMRLYGERVIPALAEPVVATA